MGGAPGLSAHGLVAGAAAADNCRTTTQVASTAGLVRHPAASVRWAMRRLVLTVLGLAVLAPVEAVAQWFACTAWGSSHTGRYTFRIDTDPCAVYWREIDAHLSIELCAPPRIVATKPFAVSSGYVVEFNLETGRFEDFTPSFSDRGRCDPITVPAP
jgi:hypothetical protein